MKYSSLIVLGLTACGAFAVACGSDDDSVAPSAGSGNASAGHANTTAGSGGKAGGGAGAANGQAGATAPGAGTAGENAAAGEGGAPGGAGAPAEGGTAGEGGAGAAPLAAFAVKKTNLVSDQANVATTMDPNLVNAWAIAINATAQVFWVSSNHGGSTPVYGADGSIKPIDPTVAAAAGADPGSPTGQVFNSTAANFMGDKFIVDTEDGQIMGWAAGTAYTQRAHSDTAIYKGLALLGSGATQQLLAANFHDARIDVFDASYAPVANADGFKDPSIPDGYAPFNVVTIVDKVYVAYAKQDADKEDDEAGVGHGYVSVFDANGTLTKSWLAGGDLDSPWAISPAPSGLGIPATGMLVGNFGDGWIRVYDTVSGALLGSLTDKTGAPIVIPGLWDLKVGPPGTTDLSGTLFFSAGPNGETHGLFGKLEADTLE